MADQYGNNVDGEGWVPARPSARRPPMNAPSELTPEQINDPVGRELLEDIHEHPEDHPVEWSAWPPPLASRSDRRACAKRRHERMIKAGYCALCGTEVTK
jgi:hypothetical protein